MVAAPAHFPLQGRSPAHGVADSAFCLPTDQLGNPRTHCDVGAIESVRDPDAVTEPEAELPADCTLADQIIAANRDAPAGACPAGDGADIIRLRRNIRLSAPLPSITSDLALDGRGHTISGDSRFRIFDIEAGKVVVKHITINDGRNLGGQPEGFGGALTLRKSAKLIVVDGNFRNNKARMGGAVASIDGSHILILESSFLDNEASSKAGALWRDGACGHIYDVTFRRNIAGELPGSIMDDYLTHMNGGANMCTDAPDVYTLSDTQSRLQLWLESLSEGTGLIEGETYVFGSLASTRLAHAACRCSSGNRRLGRRGRGGLPIRIPPSASARPGQATMSSLSGKTSR